MTRENEPAPVQHNIALHPAQAEIYASPARFVVLSCGRRFGKTELAKRLLVDTAAKGLPVAYFAPTYKMMAEVWKSLKRDLRDLITARSEQERRLDLRGGGVVDCWSMENPDGPRGRKYALIVVDEAAMHQDADTWPAVLRPTLTDLKGRAVFMSTPRGRNWFWQLFNLGLDPLRNDWAAFSHPSTDNPHLDPVEIESARELLPSRLFEQEYLAQFVEDGGGVFRGVSEICTLDPSGPDPAGRYIFGLDWAKSEDFTVISVIDSLTKKQAIIDRFNRVSWELQKARVKALADRYKPVTIIAEENSMGGPLIEALQREGLPIEAFITTANSKGEIIEGLNLAIERRELTLLRDPIQQAELLSYEMERLPSGRYRYGAPSGMHDDTVMALALAWHGVVNQARNTITFSKNPFW